MAEILLSLTIIGVVAAITLPSLTGNINERTWNTQRKALFARFSQAIALMPALNGYGTLDGTTDTAAETFVTAGLSKVLKINNICDSEHLTDCGLPTKITDFGASTFNSLPVTLAGYNEIFNGSYINGVGTSFSYSQLDTKAAAFETANGESILVYYNPFCKASSLNNYNNWAQPYMCANFIYDLNGSKGPNTMGKDIGFITAIYSTDPVVVTANPAHVVRSSFNDASKNCRAFEDTRVPNFEELMAIFYNRKLLNTTYLAAQGGFNLWSSKIKEDETDKGIYIDVMTGQFAKRLRTDGAIAVLCVKR
ncbi:MAG: type II secretion system GspH family protein [Fusobacterium sp.]|nr:type II secretion system GspH family protein [Fusobacterium sp.]